MTMSNHDTVRHDLLQEALKSAPFEGWTPSLMQHAEQTLGLAPGTWQNAFPGGIMEVLDFSVAEADRMMMEALEARDLSSLKIRERIATCIRVRLEQQLPHREAIRRATGVYMLPVHYPRMFTSVCHTVDLMWRAAGDTSTDFNWYTKRGLLAKVYIATLLFWLNDESEGQQESWAFLDRRIANVLTLGGYIQKAKDACGSAGETITRGMQRFARQG